MPRKHREREPGQPFWPPAFLTLHPTLNAGQTPEEGEFADFSETTEETDDRDQ